MELIEFIYSSGVSGSISGDDSGENFIKLYIRYMLFKAKT